ncbi:MAG: hydrogenase iron-sulfur subunit [Thermoplasmata archaeon]|nr:hydrogenase iron-sulfur subunit [Thermoplasmata archaeon]
MSDERESQREGSSRVAVAQPADWEPRIVAFLCNWCSYAGADLAGISRIQYPPNIRVVRVMCSGRVDPQLVIYTLLEGADGVLALGCHPGDCHYQSGNLEAQEKFEALLKVLRNTGMDERFQYEWVSASEGARFAEVVRGFTDHIRSLGPSPVPEDEIVRFRLRAAIREVSDFRLRWLIGRQRNIQENGDAYGQESDREEWDSVMDKVIRDQFIRAQIIERTLEGPASVEDMAEVIDADTVEIFRHVQRLRTRGSVAIAGHRGQSPLYRATGVEAE